MVNDTAAELRFQFGENWRSFLSVLTEQRIAEATASLREMLDEETLAGHAVLDLGSGSGLFSLAAVRLGAGRVRAVDVDEDSVAATAAVKERYAHQASHWTVERGDVLDPRFCDSLGSFDLVYSWGVLHHTGSMWEALDNACRLVARNGRLFISIYNDQGWRSNAWRAVKRAYNLLPRPLRRPFAAVTMLGPEAILALRSVASGQAGSYVRAWREPGERGMSRWHDLVDWVGGYPFEVARPEQVIGFCRQRGLELTRLKTVGRASGCNQYVFQRAEDGAAASSSTGA